MLRAATLALSLQSGRVRKPWTGVGVCLKALSQPGSQSRSFHLGTTSPSSEEHAESAASATGPTPLSARGPYASRLQSRAVIRFDGPDTISFLQGLVTNDMHKFGEQPPPSTAAPVPTVNEPAAAHSPLYTGILSPQGRFLYDLVFYRPSQPAERMDRSGSGPDANGNEIPALVADVDADVVDELINTLKKHRLRAKVSFEDISRELSVWARFAGVLAKNPGAPQEEESGGVGYGGTDDQFGRSAAEASAGGWLWHKDPRLAALGQRGVFPTKTMPPLVEVQEQVGEEYYKLWRYEHGVPEGSTEIPKGEALPLEYNLDGLSAISFDKGCYVGQELTARTHHRGVIRKRLLPVQFLSPEGTEVQRAAVPGAEVIDAATGKKVGKVTAALGPRGLAHLRLEAALRESSRLQIAGEDGATVKPERPKWWPSEWGQEALVDNSEASATA